MELSTILPWALFLLFVAGMLALDLGVFHRNAHAVSRKESLIWSVVWIGMAALFNVGIYVFEGADAGFEWTTGYLVEKSLSVDNVFVFLIIFASFRVPAEYQHRVLFWGIIGALIMRAILIVAGAALLESAHWIIYIFGAFLVFTGIRFLRERGHAVEVHENRLVRLARRLRPTTETYEGQKFFVRRDGVLFLTPLFLVLLLIESTDLIFAVDSIPAIFAITEDPFIVFTSNIFAILGLRALYFVIAGYLAEMRYLKPALAVVLLFVGGKMMLVDVFHLHPAVSLVVITVILTAAVVASLMAAKRDERAGIVREGAATPPHPAPADAEGS